jgi:hypothetical protein
VAYTFSYISHPSTGPGASAEESNPSVEKRLAIIAGYKDTREYFSQHVKALSQTTLSLYGRVANAFTEEFRTRYGPYKLRALLVYMEAIGSTVGTGDLADAIIDVPQDDGKVVQKPFVECSVDEIERATKAKKAPPKQCGMPGPRRAAQPSSGVPTRWGGAVASPALISRLASRCGRGGHGRSAGW